MMYCRLWKVGFGWPLEANGREVAEDDVEEEEEEEKEEEEGEEEDIPGLSSVFHTRWRCSSEPILL